MFSSCDFIGASLLSCSLFLLPVSLCDLGDYPSFLSRCNSTMILRPWKLVRFKYLTYSNYSDLVLKSTNAMPLKYPSRFWTRRIFPMSIFSLAASVSAVSIAVVTELEEISSACICSFIVSAVTDSSLGNWPMKIVNFYWDRDRSFSFSLFLFLFFLVLAFITFLSIFALDYD